MCLAYPGKVIEIKNRSAIVKYPDGPKKVLVGENNVSVGDSVLVQMGIIIKVISTAEAKNIRSAWKEIK